MRVNGDMRDDGGMKMSEGSFDLSSFSLTRPRPLKRKQPRR